MSEPLTPRKDPFFERQTPLLFAHRGGVLEAPESTLEAFQQAARYGADVLEMDVHAIPPQQGSKDRVMVVWHGPSLHNLRLTPEAKDRLGSAPSIENATWDVLQGSQVAPPSWPRAQLDLLPDNPAAYIRRLDDLLEKLDPELPINVEMKKETFIESSNEATRSNVEQLQALLGDMASRRKMVLASQSETLLGMVDRSRFRTSLSFKGVLAARFGFDPQLTQDRALQVPWWPIAAPRWLLRRVRGQGSACHVFISNPLGIDDDDDEPHRSILFRLLDRGVDGVMTDRPSRVRTLIDEWRKERGYA